MIKELNKEEQQQLENILLEKLSYIMLNKRNLFNFECLDKINLDIREMIKTLNFIVFKDYDNIYEVIDNFEDNIIEYIDTELKKLGDD